jgi:acyl-CoA synthetase (AMP-forming)/AMP-acid ligase II
MIRDRILTFRFHVMAFSVAVTCLVVGATYALPLVKNYPPTPKQLLTNTQVEQINKLISVPILLEQVVQELESDESATYTSLSRMRFVVYGGASMPDRICHKLIDNGVNLVSIYGTTEVVSRYQYFT